MSLLWTVEIYQQNKICEYLGILFILLSYTYILCLAIIKKWYKYLLFVNNTKVSCALFLVSNIMIIFRKVCISLALSKKGVSNM
jgi:hypothetical protein